MKKVRFATIGTNFITERFLEAGASCDSFELKAVYSRDKAKGQGFIKGQEGIAVYDSLEEVASDPNVDAVYIASPNCLHKEQTINMLRGGKHVLVEKAAASNHPEWETMLLAAKDSDLILLEAMRPLYNPGFHSIKENLTKLGTIRKVSFTYCQYSSRYDNFKKGVIQNAFRPELSNGALMDIGIYCIEPLVSLFGTPDRVEGKSYILENSIDGMGSIYGEYEGMQAFLSYSKISNSKSECEIQGENGTLIFQNIAIPKNARIHHRNGEVEQIFKESIENDMLHELEAFIRMIHKEEDPQLFQKITSHSLKIMDQVRGQTGIVFPADQRIEKL